MLGHSFEILRCEKTSPSPFEYLDTGDCGIVLLLLIALHMKAGVRAMWAVLQSEPIQPFICYRSYSAPGYQFFTAAIGF
jgi:hypothetical protein